MFQIYERTQRLQVSSKNMEIFPTWSPVQTEEKVPSMSVTLSDRKDTPPSGCNSKYSVLYNLNHYSIELRMTSQADIKSVFLTHLQGYVHVICLQIKSGILEGCKAWFRTGFMMLLSITYWRKEQKFK